MVSKLKFVAGFKDLFSNEKILSLSGESGTGKTTLALYLVGNLLTLDKQFLDSCIWIQASEYFPKKRLIQMFSNYPNKLQYINENLYVIPKHKPISTYRQQSEIFHTLFNPTSLIPPNLKYVVIDNVSHHLRFKIAQSDEFSYTVSVLDDFYESQLLPIILFCQRNDITLILIHEVSFNPNLMKNRLFFHKLYDRIRTIDITLSSVYNSKQKILDLSINNHDFTFNYTLVNQGIFLTETQ